ncbi:MAG: amidohydrolase family protein [Cyanobacteria bacterium SZAS-4]|nr:amidohydrolase family protein [Cyanobacteria bacterium SZAS-4]
MRMHCDLVLKNGFVFDGINEGKFVDIAVHDGRIAALGPNLDVDAAEVVDVSGSWITPGLVDIHTHYDLEVEVAPSLSESVRHGVTSVVMGGCSLSTTFGDPQDLAHIFSRVETLPAELISGWLNTAKAWSSPQQYFDHLRQLRLGPNIASMLGHSALRVQVMGLERSLSDHASFDEIDAMKRLAESALDAGCIGISIDMVHWHKVSGPFAGQALPSHHAAFVEYKMLADVCRSRNAVFQVTPNPQNPWSLVDILRLSPGMWRAPLRNTILAALDMDSAPQLWRIYPFLLFICNQLFGCNIRFQTLAEPFVIYADGCLTPFFEEFSAGVRLNNCKSRSERQALWSDPKFKEEFKKSWYGGFPRTFHRNFDLMTIANAPDATLAGQSVGQAARNAGVDPLQYFMSLLEKYDEDLRWFACNANQRPNVRQKLISHPHILPGFSDAGAHSRNLAFFDNALSVLRQAATTEFLPFHKAVARVTSEPASWFNLDAGSIRLGGRADITILDPAKLKSPVPGVSVISDPIFNGAPRMVKRDVDGTVHQVFVNGTAVVRDGVPLPILEEQKHGDLLIQLNRTKSQHQALELHRNRIADNVSYLSEVFDAGETNAAMNVDYWPIFLLKHQNPANVAMHCFGFVLMYAIPALAIADKNFWILLLMPISQATGLLGHWLFERSPIDQRDTLFSWRAFASLHMMFLYVLTGRYGSELARAQINFARKQRAQNERVGKHARTKSTLVQQV